jgi:hypothetical protein
MVKAADYVGSDTLDVSLEQDLGIPVDLALPPPCAACGYAQPEQEQHHRPYP